MKMSELVKHTGIPRETIHFYTREGLLPRPKKTHNNQAEYGPEHIERLAMIKGLQNYFYLPLSAIKKIIREQKKHPARKPVFRLKTEYFQPLEQFLPTEIVGEETFLEATGMSAQRLADFEGWRIIDPITRDGKKVYGHDDIKIGKVIGDMRRLGLSYEAGFNKDSLKELRDRFKDVVTWSADTFWEGATRVMPAEKAVELSGPAIEAIAIFLYHLFKKMSRNEMEHHLARWSKETADPSPDEAASET
jgi:DNA-binding transcriptional MerR regulator